jgi:hypothetical protein
MQRTLILAQVPEKGQILAVARLSRGMKSPFLLRRTRTSRLVWSLLFVDSDESQPHELWVPDAMEYLNAMELTIPVGQMILFIGLISFCLLFGRFKLGLSITFCFVFYWGFIYNKDVFFTDLESSSPYLLFYFFSGFLLILFALVAFMTED